MTVRGREERDLTEAAACLHARFSLHAGAVDAARATLKPSSPDDMAEVAAVIAGVVHETGPTDRKREEVAALRRR